MSLTRLSKYVLLAAVGACASAPKSPPAAAAGTAQSEPRTRRQTDVISLEELADPNIRAKGVLEAIRTLRPNFLTVRGTISHSDPEAGKVHASIDGNGVVSLDELRMMHVASVVEIRLLNVGAAMQRFGGAAREGPVILVKTM